MSLAFGKVREKSSHISKISLNPELDKHVTLYVHSFQQKHLETFELWAFSVINMYRTD